MSKNIFKRGFTLIELLVVIAIIGILASVVLASLNSARDKGANAAAISSLNNARAQAELYYNDNNNTYTTVCTTGNNNITNLLNGAAGAVTAASATCQDTAVGWSASIRLNDADGYYCVDSTGLATTTADGATAPNATADDVTCN